MARIEELVAVDTPNGITYIGIRVGSKYSSTINLRKYIVRETYSVLKTRTTNSFDVSCELIKEEYNKYLQWRSNTRVSIPLNMAIIHHIGTLEKRVVKD